MRSPSELTKFNVPVYTKYNSSSIDSFDTKFKQLYSYLHIYYTSYEPDKESQYNITENEIVTPQIDTYTLLYTNDIEKLGDIIKYHDNKYSVPLHSFDTTSTVDDIMILQNNKYLTTNTESTVISHSHVSKYTTSNDTIIPSVPTSVIVSPNEYEIRRNQLFEDLPGIIPYST